MANAVALQPDGKAVIAGYSFVSGSSDEFALVRYNTNGSLDGSFGAGGVVHTEFGSVGPDPDRANDLVIRSDGKIAAAGYAARWGSYDNELDFALARYTTNGSLDSGFGTGGKVVSDLGSITDQANALALQPDGKLVAVGTTRRDFVLVRYTSSGALDTAFGTGGKVTTDGGAGTDAARAIAVQPDSKLVVVGTSDGAWNPYSTYSTFTLARYNPNGSLDPGFGGGGVLLTYFAGGGDGALAVAIQPDGKILAAGEYKVPGYPHPIDAGFALARYNPDGSLDPTFGVGGKVMTNLSTGIARALALQPDGKIVVAGSKINGICIRYCVTDFALARYNPDGSLDTTFGNNGLVYTDLSSYDHAYALVIQPDGNIVVAGYAAVYSSSSTYDFALVRYLPDGTLDPTFGTGGKVTTDFEQEQDYAYSLVLQPDGKIVVAGEAGYDTCVPGFCTSHSRFGLARYLPNGTLDPDFGAGGKTTTVFGLWDGAHSLTLQTDGKLIAAGKFGASANTSSGFALARYNPAGTLDPDFGASGVLTTTFGSEGSAYAVALQPDGRIVTAGQAATEGSGLDFALARYLNALPPRCPGERFNDVCPGDYFYEAVLYLSDLGAISGYSDGSFRPFNNTTRAQLTKIVALAEGWPLYTPPSPTFTDVPADHPFYQYIETAYNHTIISGYSDGTFRPYNNVTRGQLCKVVVLAEGWSLYTPPTPTFADVPTSDPFYSYIETAYSHTIISGYSDGTFRQGNNATRGQIAKIVYNAITQP